MQPCNSDGWRGASRDLPAYVLQLAHVDELLRRMVVVSEKELGLRVPAGMHPAIVFEALGLVVAMAMAPAGRRTSADDRAFVAAHAWLSDEELADALNMSREWVRGQRTKLKAEGWKLDMDRIRCTSTV